MTDLPAEEVAHGLVDKLLQTRDVGGAPALHDHVRVDDTLVDAARALGLERGENGAVESPVKRRHGPILIHLAAG